MLPAHTPCTRPRVRTYARSSRPVNYVAHDPAEKAQRLNVLPYHRDEIDLQHRGDAHTVRLPGPGDVPPRSFLARLLLGGHSADQWDATEKQYPWYVILWLTGVDYFSTLGY